MFSNKIILITSITGSYGNAVLSGYSKAELGGICIFSRDEKMKNQMQ